MMSLDPALLLLNTVDNANYEVIWDYCLENDLIIFVYNEMPEWLRWDKPRSWGNHDHWMIQRRHRWWSSGLYNYACSATGLFGYKSRSWEYE